MEKTIKQVLENPKDLFSHLAERCLTFNWYFRAPKDGGFSTQQKAHLLGRFGCHIGGADKSWCCSWDDDVYPTYEDALNVSYELLLEQFDAEYIMQVLMNPEIDPIKDRELAKAITAAERNPQ